MPSSARNIARKSSLNRRISNRSAWICRLIAASARWSDVARTTSRIAIAVTSDTTVRLGATPSGCSGRINRSKIGFRNRLRRAITSGDVAEPFQLLLDLLLGLRLFELGDLLFERVRDEFLDGRITGEIGVALHFCDKRLIELDARSEHDFVSYFPPRFPSPVSGNLSMPNSARSADASVSRLGASRRSGRLTSRMPGTTSGSMQ